MDADEALGEAMAQHRGDERAPVAALRAEALVAEHVGHQLGERLRDLHHAEARLARLEGQRVARQRRRHDRELLGQQRDQLVELEHGARPAVREQQRHGLGPRPGAWMKCRSMPRIGTVNCGKALSLASHAANRSRCASSRRAPRGRRRSSPTTRARAAARRASACARDARAGRRSRRRGWRGRTAWGQGRSWVSLHACGPQPGPC